MKQLIYLLLLFVSTPLWAENSLEEADNVYMQGHYEEAAQLYETLLKDQVNAEAYYNLGNTYYRLEDLGRAVLNYERALLLAPDHEDALYNLELCKAKMQDQFNKPSEMFFITWLRELVQSRNADQWGSLGIFLLVVSLLLFGIYRFSHRLGIRKFGFFLSMLGFVCVILVNIAAAWNSSRYQNDQRAVIVKDTHLYKSSNGEEEALRELHPGTIVEVIDSNSRGWLEVEMPNGKTGWLQQTDAIKVKE